MHEPVFKSGQKRSTLEKFAKAVYVIFMLIGEVIKYFTFLIQTVWSKVKQT